MPAGIGVEIGGAGGLTAGSSEVKFDPVALAAMLKGPDGPVYRFAIRLGDAVKERAKQEVGVDTGNLRDHIIKRITIEGDQIAVYVIADVSYALYHHEGSRAVSGKLMVFEAKDGTIVFTMKRRAIPPNRFLVRALQAMQGVV